LIAFFLPSLSFSLLCPIFTSVLLFPLHGSVLISGLLICEFLCMLSSVHAIFTFFLPSFFFFLDHVPGIKLSSLIY
jgi:hypothetical protein